MYLNSAGFKLSLMKAWTSGYSSKVKVFEIPHVRMSVKPSSDVAGAGHAWTYDKNLKNTIMCFDIILDHILSLKKGH